MIFGSFKAYAIAFIVFMVFFSIAAATDIYFLMIVGAVIAAAIAFTSGAYDKEGGE